MANEMSKLPRGRHVSTMLYESNWQHLATASIRDTDNSLDIYAKNGRIIIVEEMGKEGEHGVELFYPSTQQKITDLVAEANAYAMDAVVTIGSNKVNFNDARMQTDAPVTEQR